MRIARVGIGLVLTIACIYLQAGTKAPEITVSGKLTRVMAIGAESTGWAVELDPVILIEGRPASSIQVSDKKKGELEKLENQNVTATGTLGHRHGVETGDQPVLDVSSIKESQASTQTTDFHLSDHEWLLEDLGGSGVIDNIQATLTFPESGKVAGQGSCNRFFGPAEIKEDAVKLGPLASTRMACPEAVMNQEARYLEALQAAEHFEWKDPYLLIYCKGFEKPLRFTVLPAKP